MASGIGSRPLPNPEEERQLLSLNDLKSITYEVSSKSTYNLTFIANTIKNGIVITSAGADADKKRGLYIFGSTSNGNLNITNVFLASQSMTTTVSASGNNLQVINTASTATYLCVIMFKGDLPTSFTKVTT